MQKPISNALINEKYKPFSGEGESLGWSRIAGGSGCRSNRAKARLRTDTLGEGVLVADAVSVAAKDGEGEAVVLGEGVGVWLGCREPLGVREGVGVAERVGGAEKEGDGVADRESGPWAPVTGKLCVALSQESVSSVSEDIDVKVLLAQCPTHPCC